MQTSRSMPLRHKWWRRGPSRSPPRAPPPTPACDVDVTDVSVERLRGRVPEARLHTPQQPEFEEAAVAVTVGAATFAEWAGQGEGEEGTELCTAAVPSAPGTKARLHLAAPLSLILTPTGLQVEGRWTLEVGPPGCILVWESGELSLAPGALFVFGGKPRFSFPPAVIRSGDRRGEQTAGQSSAERGRAGMGAEDLRLLLNARASIDWSAVELRVRDLGIEAAEARLGPHLSGTALQAVGLQAVQARLEEMEEAVRGSEVGTSPTAPLLGGRARPPDNWWTALLARRSLKSMRDTLRSCDPRSAKGGLSSRGVRVTFARRKTLTTAMVVALLLSGMTAAAAVILGLMLAVQMLPR
jgi:hypothetical protein